MVTEEELKAAFAPPIVTPGGTLPAGAVPAGNQAPDLGSLVNSAFGAPPAPKPAAPPEPVPAVQAQPVPAPAPPPTDAEVTASLWRTAAEREMRGSPGYYRPASDTVPQYQVQRGPQMTPEDMATLEQNAQRQKDAADVMVGQQMLAAEDEATRAEQSAAVMRQQANEEKARATAIRDETIRRMDQADAMRNQAAEAIVQTPSEFWQSKGSGAQVAAGIAVFLDALGSGLLGTESKLADKINAQVDREIQAQAQRRRQLGDMADAYQTSADAYARLFGSPEAQDAARKAAALTAAQAEIQAQAQRAGIPLNDAKLQTELADIKSNIDLQMAKIRQDQGESVAEQHVVTQAGYVGGRAPNPAKAAEYMGKATAAGAQGQGLQGLKDKDGAWKYPVTDPFSGEIGAAANTAQMQSASDRYKTAQNVLSITRRMREIVERNKGAAYMPDRDAQALAELRSQLGGTKAVALEQGAATEDEFERNMQTLPKDKATWTKRSYEENIAGVSQVEESFVNGYRRAAGSTLHRTGERIDPMTQRLDIRKE